MNRLRLARSILILVIGLGLAACESNNNPAPAAAPPTPGNASGAGSHQPVVGSPAWMNTQGGGGTMLCPSPEECVVSDVFVRGLGDSFEPSDKMLSYLGYIREILDRYLIKAEKFWNVVVFGRTAEYRFVKNISDLPCEEAAYLHVQVDGKKSVPFGCTVGQVTYIAASNFAKLAQDGGSIRMQALALLHERVHSLCRQECTGPNKFLVTDFISGLNLLLVERKKQDEGDRSLWPDEKIAKVKLLFKRAEMIGLELDPLLTRDPTQLGATIAPRGGGLIHESIQFYKYPSEEHINNGKNLENHLRLRNELKQNIFVGVGSLLYGNQVDRPFQEYEPAKLNVSEPLELTDSIIRASEVSGGKYDRVDAKCVELVKSEVKGMREKGLYLGLPDRNFLKDIRIVDSKIVDSIIQVYGRSFDREKAEPKIRENENPNYNEDCYSEAHSRRSIYKSSISRAFVVESSVSRSTVLQGVMISNSRIDDVTISKSDEGSLVHIYDSEVVNADIVDSRLYRMSLGLRHVFPYRPQILSDKEIRESVSGERSKIDGCTLEHTAVKGSIQCFESLVRVDNGSNYASYQEFRTREAVAESTFPVRFVQDSSNFIQIEGDLNLHRGRISLLSEFFRIFRKNGGELAFGPGSDSVSAIMNALSESIVDRYEEINLIIKGPLTVDHQQLDVHVDQLSDIALDRYSETKAARFNEAMSAEHSPDFKLVFRMNLWQHIRNENETTKKPKSIICPVRHSLGQEVTNLERVVVGSKKLETVDSDKPWLNYENIYVDHEVAVRVGEECEPFRN